jgi:hypothetical protein
MEHYFSFYDITDDLEKLHIDVLYLDHECCKWCKNSHRGFVAWTQFVAYLYEFFDIDTHHLGHLTKMKQLGIVEYYITTFEKLDLRTNGMSNTFFRECFISGLRMRSDPMS